jgi:hypothetical protein
MPAANIKYKTLGVQWLFPNVTLTSDLDSKLLL